MQKLDFGTTLFEKKKSQDHICTHIVLKKQMI